MLGIECLAVVAAVPALGRHRATDWAPERICNRLQMYVPRYWDGTPESADVLLHSICDGILGALAEGDLGKHFPATDKKYKGISSLKLLAEVGKLLKQKKAKIVNIDTTIVAEKPKLASYTDKMRKNIAQTLKISPSKISVKATTQNGLGFIGKGEGIAGLAIVLIESQ